MPIFGVDVSRHQGPNLDWARIRATGIEFMFARASLATTPDDEYRGNHARAAKAGIPVLGAYHFLYPASIVSPVEQARLFVDRIGEPTGLLTMLDVERDRHHKPRIDDVRAFAETFDRLTGGHPLLLYAPAWYWQIISSPAASDLGLLVASRYVPVERTPKNRRIPMTAPEAFAKVPPHWWRVHHGGWTQATILQFTSSGNVPGHRGSIDFNAFRGTTQQLAALATPAGAASAAATPAKPTEPATPTAGRTPAPRFHVVVPGDTMIAIAARFGWKPKGGMPAFRVMLQAFPESKPFRQHPGLIHPGDRVRVG